MKRIVLPFFICFLLTVFSCSTDDKSNPDEHLNHFHKSLPEEQINYKRVKKNDLPNVAVVNEELTRIKDIIDPALIIDDEIILYAGYEGKHTLTFVTYRVDRNSDKIENIVLESRPDGKYNPYLFSYDLTLNELDNLDKLTPETIKSRSEVVPLVAGNGGGLMNISCFEAVQHFVGRWECEAGYEHEPGHPECTIGGSRWVMHPMGLTWVYVGCGDTGGGSGGSGGSGGGGAGGGTGGGGNGGDGSGSGGSTGGGTGWGDGGDGDGSGGPIQDNDYNLTEGQTIVTQPIVFEPEFLQILLDDSFTENDCLMGVYNQLGGSPTFQDYLQNFDGDFSIADLKLSAGQIPSYPYAFAYTFPPYIDNLIEVRINDNKLNRPALDIARTLIHEMLHAEIFRKLLIAAETGNLSIDNWSQEQVINYVNNLNDNFNGLYVYYKKFQWDLQPDAQLSSVQHELLADNYRNVIIDVMKEFDDSYPEEIYEALSWEGLMGEGNPEDINPETGLPEYPTQAWIQKTIQERLNILSIINNFKSSVSACQ